MGRRRLSGALLTAIVLAAAAPAGAGETARTELIIKSGDTISKPPLYGRVKSDEDVCLKGRRVAIIMVAPDQGLLDYADNKTNAKGKWEFSSQLEGGTAFKAQVKKRTVDGVTCVGATSGTVPLG